MEIPGTVLLSGIVGSQAYGLAMPGSDVDRLGIYALPTAAFHGLRAVQNSVVLTEPSDHTFHEAAKFCRLVLNGNPTVNELLWLPDDLYEVQHDLGLELIELRGAFLSAPRVRDAYLGYAKEQFDRLVKRDGSFGSDLRKRTAKHARHLLRLMIQGYGLYATGKLQIRLGNPDEVRAFGEAVAEDWTAAQPVLEDYETRFRLTRSVLPAEPDAARVEEWLLKVRREFFS